MKKTIISTIFLTLFLLPNFSFAADCSSEGSSVVYINGIFTSENQAQDDLKEIKREYKNKTGTEDVYFLNGYNESHIAGLGDIIKVLSQMQKGASLDYDLTNILRQVNEELSTRKVLLVGHSQGTFYTNAAYDYLIRNGVPRDSIAVYNIATPADFVAGGGRYLTSSTDKVISGVAAELAQSNEVFNPPLPPNIYISLNREESADKYGGHSLSGVYLKNAPDRIVREMKSAIDGLSVPVALADTPPDGGCFVAPKMTLSHGLKTVNFKVGDSTAWLIGGIAGGTVKVAKITSNFVFNVAYKIYKIGEYSVLEMLRIIKERPEILMATVQTNPDKLFNVSAENPPPEDKNFVRSDLTKFTGTGGTTQDSVQDKIDDILEKIDILQRKIADIKAAENPTKPAGTLSLLISDINNENDELTDNQNDSQNNNVEQNNNQNNNNQNANAVNNSVGGGRAIYYGKILISEVQVGGTSDSKEEFVELYNMEAKEIDLTDWYLQRKTKTGSSYSSFAPNTLFAGKKITANGYLVIARTGYFGGLGDIFTDNPLTEDNTLVLKNPGGEISDKVGWGQSQDYELIATQNHGAGQSIGRKIVSNEPTDTDVNLMDFEFGNPTPKAKNVSYTSPPAPPAPPEPKDTIAPRVIFNIVAIQEQLSFAVGFEIIDPLGVVSSSGVASYVFRWKEEGGGWQEDSNQQIDRGPSSIFLTREFLGDDEKIYYFQAKAKDTKNNESDWLTETPAETKISVLKKVIINEIQAEGTTAKDEFIELYNPNAIDINLEGFALKKKTSGGTESNLVSSGSFSGIIKALGYFLITPQDNDDDGSKNYTGLAEPDLRYSGKTYSFAKNNTILLYNKNGTLLDKVGFGEAGDFETTPTTNPEKSKSIERKIIGGDTDNNSADFRVSENPTPKASFMQIGLKDATDYDPNFGSNDGANFYQLTIEWLSKTPNISFYQVQHKINDEDWENWIENTTDTKGDFIAYYSALSVENTHSFRARTQDTNGNQSDWAQIDIDLSAPIIVNEFALFGTNADRGDIWVELYNKSDKVVDLTGWHLKSNNSLTPLNGVIPANGYFVMEKNNDNAVSDSAANQIFSENLTAIRLNLLDNKNRTIDQVHTPNGGWQEHHFKKDDNFYSVERISPYAEGIKEQNWRINNGLIINGADKNGSPILGTPGGQNSNHQIYTVLPTGFGGKAVLPKNLSPYLAVGFVKILENAVATIEPGAIIKFYNNASGFIVNGTLLSEGLETEKIVFTSFSDDSYGGDSNSDGSATSPSPGNWLGLQFTKTSKNSELENILMRYTGAFMGFSPASWGKAVWAEKSDISFKNSVIEYANNIGLNLINSSSVVDNISFLEIAGSNNKAVFIEGGKPEIRNSRFYKNYNGIYISSFYDNELIEAAPVIANNDFQENERPIFMGDDCYPEFSGNNAQNNYYNAIIFWPGNMQKDIELKPDLPYVIKSIITVPENKTLTLAPGVAMKFADSNSLLLINGTLLAKGTPENPITFGPYPYGNEQLSPGKWRGLRFTKTSKNSELENVEIFYGGAITGESPNAAIKVEQSAISLKNSVLRQNANTGIWLINSLSVIDSVQFLEHKEKTSSLDPRAVYVQGGKPEIKNSFFKDNYYGIYIDNWLNEETGENIFGTPILENNQFEGSIGADIRDNNPPPPPSPPPPPPPPPPPGP